MELKQFILSMEVAGRNAAITIILNYYDNNGDCVELDRETFKWFDNSDIEDWIIEMVLPEEAQEALGVEELDLETIDLDQNWDMQISSVDNKIQVELIIYLG